MSNLWFFGLRRPELPERRRSSGEQSSASECNSTRATRAAACQSDREQEEAATRQAPPSSPSITVAAAAAATSSQSRSGRAAHLWSSGQPAHPAVVRSDSSGEEPLCVPQPQHQMMSCSRLNSFGSVESSLLPPNQQQQGLSGAGTNSVTLDNEQKLKRVRLLHQLISGQVPPIQERRVNQQQQQQPSQAGSSRVPSIAHSMDNIAALIPRVRVEFYNSENTLKEQLQMYFIKDHTVSLYVRSAKLILKVLACYLYVCRVILDRGPAHANCFGCQAKLLSNSTTGNQEALLAGVGQQLLQVQSPSAQSVGSKFDSHPYDGPINFRALFWVDRGPVIWWLQTSIAVICLFEAILMQYLTYKNSIFSLISFHFTLEIVTNTPFIASIFCKELRTLFVPGFLNCWLAKQCLEAMLNDLSIVRQSSVFSHRLTILSATVFCLIFTSACGFQHTQRSGGRNYINIFESVYFVVVTFSTVGYGDFKPETWPSQLFITVMICVALIVLPSQFEQLAYFWIERKKLGASYAHHSTRHEKHVVVCSTTLRADTIMDFLNEFYAHPLLQAFSVVLLSPCELDTTMKLVLQTPTWNNRVVYIQGSALKAGDLIRARMQSAEACFILAARNYNDRSAADEHTILRSWAIRDFSPYVPQYVQIFRTENKIHVAFAEHVVCDDEFKYALLANNCLIPGTSTLVTLLLHTSQRQSRRRRLATPFSLLFGRRRNKNRATPAGTSTAGSTTTATGSTQDPPTQDDSSSDEPEHRDGAQWKRLYGRCSANEIYHIRLSDSRFFGEYQGKSFTYASFHSHRKFGVALIGVQTDMRGTWPIMLNPGPSYVLKSGDILFYINITKEENSTLMPMLHEDKRQDHFPSLTRSSILIGASQSTSPINNNNNNNNSGTSPASSFQPSNPQQPTREPSIRVEASSPTVPAKRAATSPSEQEPAPPDTPPPSISPLLAAPAYSVAAGAGAAGRSLCSVAGLAAAQPAASELIATHPSSLLGGSTSEINGTELDARKSELHYLAANLLAKRNSTASASAAMGVAISAPTTGGLPAGSSKMMGSRHGSTLELAALASNLRKGSNMSISSSKSRDISPTRLKQVVSGLAVKMKRVKLGKSLTHLTIPRMDYGGGSSVSSTESFVNARGRRPSIAPVPAMMGESEEHDSDHEREQESYFAMSWQSNTESSPIVKKFVFCTTYVGVSPTLCYMLQRKKAACCLQLISACEHCPFKNARQYNWTNRCIILASDFASNGIYNFLVPLRAHFHNPTELRPIVLLLERKPSPQFIDAISWFPMVYWMPGSIDNLDDLIKAGINLAHSVVVTNKESTNSAEEDYLADCNTIVAVQTMFKMFPSVGIITELSQSSNMRFMQFRAHDVLFGNLSMSSYYHNLPMQQQQQQQQPRIESGDPTSNNTSNSNSNNNNNNNSDNQESNSAQSNAIRDRIHLKKLHSQHFSKERGKQDVNSHAYKYRLPFAAGNVFSASMLDTLLYQAFVKDYMITMVRLLLGIDQAPGSGFLSSMRITKADLWIRTYGRLYQRLCSTTCEIPLGIYRTEPLETQHSQYNQESVLSASSLFGPFASQRASYEHATEELERIEITNMVKNRLQDLGMLVTDYDDSLANRNNTFSYVIINPNCDINLREGDIIYLIRPSPIHSRKLFLHRANSVRRTDDPTSTYFTSSNKQQKQSNSMEASDNQRASSDQQTTKIDSGLGTSGQADQLIGAQQQVYIKSCLSDGDFNEILIKVDDQQLDLHQQQCPSHVHKQHQRLLVNNQPSALSVTPCDSPPDKTRRRSSCSDANESLKRLEDT